MSLRFQYLLNDHHATGVIQGCQPGHIPHRDTTSNIDCDLIDCSVAATSDFTTMHMIDKWIAGQRYMSSFHATLDSAGAEVTDDAIDAALKQLSKSHGTVQCLIIYDFVFLGFHASAPVVYPDKSHGDLWHWNESNIR